MYIQCSTHIPHPVFTVLHNRKGGWEGEIEGERREREGEREGGRKRKSEATNI